MNIVGFAIYSLVVLLLLAVVVYYIYHRSNSPKKHRSKASARPAVNDQGQDVLDEAKEDVEHIFNDDFREELRNRGRLHFEKIINENAMFLQQDLRLTTSQINEFMKDEITSVLKEEFSKYEASINQARDQAIETIEKTQNTIEEQLKIMEERLVTEVANEKERIVSKFEQNMGQVLNHYVLEAIGNEIDLTNQLDYIFTNLEESKKDIIEDIRTGA